jgi:ABC-type hemin transport system substrate-binding protein
MHWSSTVFGLLLGFLLVLIASCARHDQSQNTTNHADDLRLVSLSPAISRALVDLELAAHLVGRSPFCESVDQAIPVVGDLLNLDYERLLRVQPTHVLVQPPATGVDPNLLTLAARHNWTVATWPLHGISDIDRMLRELPEIIEHEGLPQRSSHLRQQMDAVLTCDEQAMSWDRPTMLITSLDPVGAFGRETYLHDVLVGLCGINAVTASHYPQFTLEDVVRMNPQAIILVRPGTSPDAPPSAAMRTLMSLDIAAVRNGRVAVLHDDDAFLPSSSIVNVAGEMRDILRRFADSSEQQP